LATGHDTATLKAFSGKAGLGISGEIGGRWSFPCQSIRHPVSLRLSAKRGIVAWLNATGQARIRDRS
jgi:hypothetical protein